MEKFKIIYKRKKITGQLVALLLTILLIASCKKLIEIPPPETAITSGNVFNDDETAIAAVTGIFTKLSARSIRSTGMNSTSFYTGLSGDELALSGSVDNDQFLRFYQNNLQSVDDVFNIWVTAYSDLYTVNSAIEGLSQSSHLTEKVKLQLLGEVKFLRAFYYFYLVNMYGDVPLVIGTDYQQNSILPREKSQNVYLQMLIDCNEAKTLLNESFLGKTLLLSTNERLRPTKWAASALLARIYLYLKDWDKAENEASFVIDNSSLFGLETLDNVFLANNKEAIWQLQPISQGWNTEDARTFVIPSTGFGTNNPVYLSNNFMSKFEPNDKRKSNWTTIYADQSSNPVTIYFYPYKYRSATLNSAVTEYSVVLRLAEQYLIRAEARAHLNNIDGGIDDIDRIRSRADLPLIRDTKPAISQNELLAVIQKERASELFTEWGHRWFDLKRTNSINEVMQVVAPLKGSNWNANWALYPIPAREIERNPKLTQNLGY